MRISVTYPYLHTDLSPTSSLEGELAEIAYDDIIDLVKVFMLKKGFLTIEQESGKIGEIKVNVPESSLTLENRLFCVNFYHFYDEDGNLRHDLLEQFADGESMERISWFIGLGDILKVRFGIPMMNQLANRLFETYYSSLEVRGKLKEGTTAFRDIAYFGEALWPLFLAHHVSKLVYYGDGSIS